MQGPEDHLLPQLATITPYLDRFKEWALAQAKAHGLQSGAFITSRSLRGWDQEFNYRRIEKSFGSDEDIREAGIKALYTRVLGHYLAPTVLCGVGSHSASPTYKLNVSVQACIRGVYIAEASAEEQNLLIREQTEVIRRANRRLAYYKMPLADLKELFQELIQHHEEVAANAN